MSAAHQHAPVVLMPFLMWALLRCVNDAELMHDKPQSATSNVLMFLSVGHRH